MSFDMSVSPIEVVIPRGVGLVLAVNSVCYADDA